MLRKVLLTSQAAAQSAEQHASKIALDLTVDAAVKNVKCMIQLALSAELKHKYLSVQAMTVLYTAETVLVTSVKIND